MKKKKWLHITGLILVCHLALVTCQSQSKDSDSNETSSQRQTRTESSSTEKKSDSIDSNKSSTTDKEAGKKDSKNGKTDKAIPGVTVPTSDGFQLTDNSSILSKTKDGIIVDHDGHSHFIFYSDLKGTKFAHLIPEDAVVTEKPKKDLASSASDKTGKTSAKDDHHYVFSASDIVAEDEFGYTVRHDDHFHYIPKKRPDKKPNTDTAEETPANTGNIAAPETSNTKPEDNTSNTSSDTNTNTNTGSTATPPTSSTPITIGKPSQPKGIPGIDFPTSDGFLFNGSGIKGWTKQGLLVDHNGHLHVLLRDDLAKSKWAHLLKEDSEKPTNPETPSNPNKPEKPTTPSPTFTKEEIAAKRAYLAKNTGLPLEAIIVEEDNQIFRYLHNGDHWHAYAFSAVDITKPFDDGHGSGNNKPETSGTDNNKPTTDSQPEAPKTPDEIKWTEELLNKRTRLAEDLNRPVEDFELITYLGEPTFKYREDGQKYYQYMPSSWIDLNRKKLTPEEKRELTAHIRKLYGLLQGTPVEFKGSVAAFAIPHPHQDYSENNDYHTDTLDPRYDAGHVHPFTVFLDRLIIPEKTNNAELNFENELLAFSKLSGLPVSQIKIDSGKYFVLPGKGHDHYVNIFALDGLKDYKNNSLELIKPRIANGDFNKEIIETEINRIRQDAKEKLGDDTLEYRRVLRALEQYQAEITTGAKSTSQGYLDALKSFESRYVLKDSTTENPLPTNLVEERASKLIDSVNALAKKANSYGLDTQNTISKLKTAVENNDTNAIDRIESYLNAIKRTESAPKDQLPRAAYLDYFLRHVDSAYLSPELREKVSEKILELHSYDKNNSDFKKTLESTVNLKTQVKDAISAAQTQPIEIGKSYTAVNKKKIEIVGRVNHWANIFHYAITEEEKQDGFNRKLQVIPAITPTKPATPAPSENQPTNPKDDSEKAPGTETTTTNPKETTPVSLEAKHTGLTEWLNNLTAANRRLYKIEQDSWATAIDSALTAKDAENMDKFNSYMAAIERVEKQKTHAGARIAYLDYFIRHLEQPYLNADLREKLAARATEIPAYSSRDFKQNLTDTVDLKLQVKAATTSGENHALVLGPSYTAFLEKKAELIKLINDSKDFLLNRQFITEEEKAEGFGQPYPEAPTPLNPSETEETSEPNQPRTETEETVTGTPETATTEANPSEKETEETATGSTVEESQPSESRSSTSASETSESPVEP